MNNLQKFSYVFLAAIFLVFLASCSGKGQKENKATSSFAQSSDTLDNPEESNTDSEKIQLDEGTEEKWRESFSFVRDEIHFEPSTDIYEFGQGILWSRQGNAKEQAVYLADILGDEGEEVRFVRGKLDNDKAALLIGSMFPEKKDFSYNENVLISNPSQNKELVEAVRNHWWVQIFKKNQWIDLDPCFPDAEVGKAYASVEETFDNFDEDLLPKLTISLDVEKGQFKENRALNPETENVLEWEGTIQEVLDQPLTLKIIANFRAAKEEEEEKGLGGMFGDLAGREKKASGKKTKKFETIYQASLIINNEEKESSAFSQIVPGSSKQKEEEETVTKLTLHFKMENYEGKTLDIDRILFEKQKENGNPRYFQRHSILITTNDIPKEAWEKDLKKVLAKEKLDELEKDLEEIKTKLKKKKDINDLYQKCIALENVSGSEAGHLINMIFASISDQISRDLGQALSVFSYYSLPRIIINTVEGTGDELQVFMDLRQDSKQAIPYPGQAARMSETFLYGRGVMDSILEGKVLELLTGKKSLTTAHLMEIAADKKIPIRMFSHLEQKALAELRLPFSVAQKAKKVIESGCVLIIPDKAIEYNGNQRWGWWDLNPQNGEVVGVLDSGLHQAMIERTILDTEGMMNDNTGLVVGAMVGSVDTYWVLFALILKYGELDKAALEEAKAYMKAIGNYLCPEFEKKLEVGVGVSVELEDCWKKEIGIGLKGGLKIDMGWCAKFAKGFKCASTTILNVYLSGAE